MYTKGEWYQLVDRENRHHVMSRGKTGDMEQNVAVMSVRPEAVANAQLIASAPDLYEALKAFLNVRPRRFEQGEKALAKVEGK